MPQDPNGVQFDFNFDPQALFDNLEQSISDFSQRVRTAMSSWSNFGAAVMDATRWFGATFRSMVVTSFSAFADLVSRFVPQRNGNGQNQNQNPSQPPNNGGGWFDSIVQALSGFGQSIRDLFSSVFPSSNNNQNQNPNQPPNNGGGWFDSIIEGAKQLAKYFVSFLPQAMQDFIRSAKATVDSYGGIFGTIRAMASDFVTSMRDLFNIVSGAARGLARSFISVLPQAMQDFINNARQTIQSYGGIFGTLRQMSIDFVQSMRDLFRLIVDAGRNLASYLYGLLPQALRNFITVVAATAMNFARALGGFAQSVGQLIAIMTQAITPYIQSMLSGIGSALATGFQAIIGAIPVLLSGIAAVGGLFVGAIGGVIGSIASTVGNVISAMGSFVMEAGEMAAGLAAAGFMISKVVKFIDPGAVELFNMLLKDLGAVLGTALRPVLIAITGILRDFGDMLFPIAKQLSVIFEKLMEALRPLIQSIFELAGEILESLIPVFDIIVSIIRLFAGMIAPLLDTLRILREGAMALAASLLGFTGADAADFVSKVVDEMLAMWKNIMKYGLITFAQIAKMFGATSFIDGMIKGIMGNAREDTTGLAAAQNPAYKSIEGLGKDMALAAAIATGGGAESKKTPDDWAKETIDQLKDVKQNGMTLNEFMKNLPAAIAQAFKAILPGSKEAGDIIYEMNPLKGPGEALGDWISSKLGYS